MCDHDWQSICVMTRCWNEFIRPSLVLRRVSCFAVRCQRKLILTISAYTIKFTEHFSRETHHSGGFGSVDRKGRIDVHTVSHRYMPHVLDTADNEYVTIACSNRESCRMNC